MKSIIKQTIADNISRACKAVDWNGYTLEAKTGVNQTTFARLMRGKLEESAPKIDTIDYAMMALKLEPWSVMIPGASVEVMKNKKITELLIKLNQCSHETRERVLDNALDTLMLEKLKNNT